MAAAKGKKFRGVLRLRGGQVDLAIGILAAALLEVRSASAEDIKFDGLSRLGDPKLADQVNGVLREAVATNDIKTMSLEELRTLLSPEHLADLGIDAKEFAELLQHDPKAAIAKLEAAFAHKLHLASFDAAHKAVATFAADDAGGGSAAAASGGESMLTPALIIGGVIAGGVGVGFLVGSGGNSSSSGSQGGQSVNSPPLAITETITTSEDTPITFDPRTNDTDANGDALTITAINGTAISATTPVTVAGVGTFSLNANGTLTFTPVANFNGSPTIAYTVADPSGATSTVTDTLNVTAVNDAPVAVADAVTTAEDTPITFDPRTNDTDVDANDTKTIKAINGTAIDATHPVTVAGVGTFVLNAGGTLTFTPVANYNGASTFTYTIADASGATSTVQDTLTVSSVNDAPVNAVPVSLSGSQAATIAINGITVSDVDSTSLTTTLHVSAGLLTYVTVAGGATVTGTGTDTLVFTGTAAQINLALGSINFNGGPSLFGTQTLTVTTSDGTLTDTDTINLTIGQVATQTIALSDGYIEGATVFIDVNGDGIYEDGEPKGFSDGTGHYLIVGNGTGTLIAFGGSNLDTGLPNDLVLMAPAGASAINPLTTVITALISGGMSADDAMAALVKSLGLPPGTDLLHLDILSPDTDPALQLAAQKAAVEIALTLDAVVHGGGDQAALLAKLADAYSSGDPVDLANPDTLASLFSGVGLSDADAASLALSTASSNNAVESATSLDDVSHVQQEAGNPDNDFAPVTRADIATTTEDKPVTFDPRANDADPEGKALTITAINGTAIDLTHPVTVPGGVISLNADGTLTYTPSADFNGDVPTIVYTVVDPAGNATDGTVDLSVTPVNDSPVAVADTVTINEDTAITFDPRDNDTDVDGDKLKITAINGVSITLQDPVAIASGIVSLNGNGSLTFTPNANFNGTPSFSYTVSDGNGGTSTATVNLTVTAVNDAPVTTDDTVQVAKGTSVTFDVRTNDSDPEGDALHVTKINGNTLTVGTPLSVAGGSIVLNTDGTLTFTAEGNFNGQRNFTYTVSDSQGATSDGKLTVTAKAVVVNSAPVAVADTVTTTEDKSITFDVRTNDTDADGDKLTVTQINGTPISVNHPVAIASGIISLNGNGTLTFDPNADFNGTPTFNYTVSDGNGGTSTATVSLTVAGVNDAPVAVADAVTTAEDTPITFDPRINDTDVDTGDTKTVTQINGTAIDTTHPVTVTGGVVSLNADGTLTFTPSANFNGTPTFSYTIADSAGATSTATVSLTVTPVNDAPVAIADAASTAFQAPVTIDVLANDTDVDSANLTITAVNGTAITAQAPVLVTGGFVSLVDGKLVFTPNFIFTGTASFTYTASDGTVASSGQVSVTVASSSGTLGVSAASIATVVLNATALAADGVQHLDVIGTDPNGDPLTITDAQANALANAGIDFVASDDITVEENSEHALTTLKKLEGLNVDGVKAKAVGGLSIDAGAGGLGGLDAGSLPTFTGATGEAVDVTLNIDSGSLDPALDLGTLVPALGAAGIDHVNVTGDGHLSVSLDQAESFVGSGVDFVAGNDITLNVASAQIGVVTGSASGLGAAHIDHIDVTDNSVTIDDGQATSLINAGLDFVTSDNVTVEVAGTHTSTTLKGLQDLHVDSVKAKAVGGLSIDAGSGGLGGLSAGGLPHFITDGGATAHVTLDIASGTLGSDVNLGDLAPALHTAGIDHIDVTGSGDFTLSAGQALDIANAGVDFVASDNITITTGADQIAAVVGGASALGAAHIDHIDVTGDQITIDDSQASSLVSAGLDFVTGDDVTVSVDGTHLSTSLKGLQDLHVDSVAAKSVGFVSIDAGSGPLSADNLPSFTIAQSDAALDVTLNVNDGVLPGTTDIFHLAPALGAAGIDHIGVSGDGHLTLSAEQALDFVHSGVDFASAADITVSLTAANLPAAIGHAGELSALNVDHLDVSGHVVLDDTQAATLIGDGLDFATADDITVQAHGTHLSTSLGGLQALHVDTVVGDGIHNIIKLDAGDFSLDSALPQFAGGLDVTLDTHSTDFLNGDIVSLTDSANKLLAAGIDHIGIEQPLETLTADQLATIAQIEHDTGLNFVYDPTPAASAPDFGSLVSLLEGVQPTEPTVAGVVAVSDAATASLIQSGALQSFLGETLVVDATDSGDKMLTSLKSLGDLGVDSVLLPHGDAPVYVDLGFGTATPTTAELTQLLNTVDPAGAHEPLFSGATHVGLVVDQASLDALAGVSGSLTHLADLGFTEIDVLDGTKVPDALANDPHVEIKIIGPDGDTAELYDHLHHQ
jgi:CshA-type fibril repeat protein